MANTAVAKRREYKRKFVLLARRMRRAARRFYRRLTFWRGAGYVALILSLLSIWCYLTTPDCSKLKTTNPPTSAIMTYRVSEAKYDGRAFSPKQNWVPYDRISPNLVRAVIVAEDTNFTSHPGVDIGELKLAVIDALEELSFPRGASTITQQLAKNLFLSESRSPIRKLRELFITFELEAELSKRRILELYLNIIEWGDGVFGAEAASRYYFSKSARDLSEGEAAFLAGIIPNPRTVYNPRLHPERVARRKATILRRMGRSRVSLP